MCPALTWALRASSEVHVGLAPLFTDTPACHHSCGPKPWPPQPVNRNHNHCSATSWVAIGRAQTCSRKWSKSRAQALPPNYEQTEAWKYIFIILLNSHSNSMGWVLPTLWDPTFTLRMLKVRVNAANLPKANNYKGRG